MAVFCEPHDPRASRARARAAAATGAGAAVEPPAGPAVEEGPPAPEPV
jgi:hypothetical protein